MDRAISLLGIFVLMGIAWLLSDNKKKIDWRVVAGGVVLQLIFAVLVLKTGPGRWVFARFNDLIVALLDATKAGSQFLFGGPELFPNYFTFATHVLPTIIFFSSLMGVLYYLGVMQWLVELVARVIVRVLGTSGAETLSVSGNIFVGQTEAPLLVRPYVEQMTRSELMAVMCGGFATVAGGVMAAYVGMLSDQFPDIAGHLMAASVMSAPAALVMAKLLVPETREPLTRGHVALKVPRTDANIIEAAASGATTGLTLALNVGAMLLAFLALVATLDWILGGVGGVVGRPDLSVKTILGWLFAPVAWMMGVPGKDCVAIGELLGTKIAVNEFMAYLRLHEMLGTGEHQLSPRSVVIATYALCGFANFGSIGIQIGGIGGIAPSRRSDLARLGLIAMIGGALASFQTATIAGVLTGEGDVHLVRPAVSRPAGEVGAIPEGVASPAPVFPPAEPAGSQRQRPDGGDPIDCRGTGRDFRADAPSPTALAPPARRGRAGRGGSPGGVV